MALSKLEDVQSEIVSESVNPDNVSESVNPEIVSESVNPENVCVNPENVSDSVNTEIVGNSVKTNTTKAALVSHLMQTCNSLLYDERGILSRNYWTAAPLPYEELIMDKLDSDMGDAATTQACQASNDCKNFVREQVLYKHLQLESMDQINNFADLAYVSRELTRFNGFKSLKPEDVSLTSTITIELLNGEFIVVHYKDIRYVESFVWRTQVQEMCQYRHQKKPIFASVHMDIKRLDAIERGIVWSLLACRRCSSNTLLTFFNLHLHQLSAFTFELIRRGDEMHEVVSWHLDEYMDNVERKNIKGVASRLAEHDVELSKSVMQKWKAQHTRLETVNSELIDACIYETNDAKFRASRYVDFFNTTLREIHAVDSVLESNFQLKKTFYTMCKTKHLLHFANLAYSMDTVTLRKAIQRRVDMLALIFVEHNIRAQYNQLSFSKQFYYLALENTILASELLHLQLYYDPQVLILEDVEDEEDLLDYGEDVEYVEDVQALE